jgi:RNA polymerase sigma-70 factor (ECF subfamily)
MPKQDFQDMYREQYDRVYQYAFTLLLNRENAEDVVQETFLSAYRHYGLFDPARGSIGAWLCRIAHNKAIDLQRSAAYRLRADWPEGEVEVFGKEDPAIIHLLEVNETVLFLYARLSEEEREFLNMRYVLELRDAEVAVILGIKEKTVNKRYQRLLKKCLNILSPNEP